MLPQEIVGLETESRFYRLCRERVPETPDWFLSVKEAGASWNIRGVDAFIYISPREKGAKRVKVPVQIKSSAGGKKHFALKHPQDSVENIVVIVVKPHRSDDQVRQQIYTEVGRVRKEGKRFDDFFARAMSRRLSKTSRTDFLMKQSKREKAYRRNKAETE